LFFLKCVPHVPYRCRACGCTFRPNPRWEWIGDVVGGLGVANFIGLACFGVIRWSVAVIGVAVIFALGFILFPYFTPFDLVDETHSETKLSP
jgi:hypothetical protein